jgi:microcin C transport system substrate-binding protein
MKLMLTKTTRLIGVALVATGLFSTQHAGAQPKVFVGHAFSMYGDLKYPAGFKHFDYANPAAPKGGNIKLAAIGTFDSLNPSSLKGVCCRDWWNIDTLTVGSSDEPFTRYGLVADSIEMDQDRSWVAFTIRPEARFHDGSPITVEDVIWTFEALKTKGHPFYKAYYTQVVKVEKVGNRKVQFFFGPGENRELPLITAELPVLSKTYWSKRDFEKTTLEPPLGSGPYRVESVEPALHHLSPGQGLLRPSFR